MREQQTGHSKSLQEKMLVLYLLLKIDINPIIIMKHQIGGDKTLYYII